MSFLGRVAALGRGTMDQVLSRAEVAVGIKGRPAAAIEGPMRLYGSEPELPFFPLEVDWRTQGLEIVKAAVPNATSVQVMEDGPARKPKAQEHDPFQMVELLGYKERPTGLAYVMLERMVRQTHVAQAIILTRVSQVVRHCRPQEDRYAIGYRISHRDRKMNLSKAARSEAERIQKAIQYTTTGEPGVARDNFGKFTSKLMRDSLTYDQMCWENVPTRRGKPYSWKAVDAKTIRLVDTAERFEDRKSDRAIRTVQVLEGQPINEWPASELIFAVRNPNSSIQSQGYGFSELEMALHVITHLLWATQYNAKFFSQGSTPKGVLNFKGQVPGRQLAAFRRFFYQMLAGVENSWRTPVLNAEQGVEWVSMHSSNRDMEYGNWLDFLIKLLCAMYLLDPAEVNFKYGNEGDRSLFESANQQKITQSKDRGLKPLLVWYAEELNRNIVNRIDEDFELEFLGLDALTPSEQADLDEKQGRTYLTVDEIRERDGRKPLPNDEGKVIANASWMQYKQSLMSAEAEAKMAEQQGGAMGPDGEPTGGPPGADGGPDGQDFESMFGSMASANEAPPGKDQGAKAAPKKKAVSSFEV